MSNRVLLVSANEMRPPVGPIALDYLACALRASGFEPHLCDLAWEADRDSALQAALNDADPVLVGLTVRNTDDCYMAGQYSCLDNARAVARAIHTLTDAPLVVGGVGFSVMPEELVPLLGADFGVAGEGEAALPSLAQALSDGKDPRGIPGLVFCDESGSIRRNPPQFMDLASFDPSARDLIDNARYWQEGGQGGFETKRGCDRRCIYCADPLSKGRVCRLRDPQSVAREVASLAEQGVVHLHTCDAEFNVPRSHALAVCEAIAHRGLGERVRWWAYCAPAHFDDELARAMCAAGCVGVNFGADHGCDVQLARLGRDHRAADLERAASLCRTLGIACMFDLLLGAPGDTREGIRTTLELMRRLEPTRVGISLGVRVYPGTPLAEEVIRGPLAAQPGLSGNLTDNDDLTRPVFFLEPALGPDIMGEVAAQVSGDKRFFCADPEADLADYNYRENTTLTDAIAAGHRGAFWDILRRLQEGLPPA
jgi:radical SAM superfamily enzyme YgiQ (UPF0313 family)